MSRHRIVALPVVCVADGEGGMLSLSDAVTKPEILALVAGPGGLPSYVLDYDDAVMLRDWLSAWITRRDAQLAAWNFDPPAPSETLDEWKELDPERIVMLTGPGDHSAQEQPAMADVGVERCPECGWATIHTRDCSRRQEPDMAAVRERFRREHPGVCPECGQEEAYHKMDCSRGRSRGR